MKNHILQRLLHKYILLSVLLSCLFFQAKAQLKADFNTIDGQTTGCSPVTVFFKNLTKGASSNAVFKWDFGNGNSVSNSDINKTLGATYNIEKNYTVTLFVTDGAETSSKTLNITVYKKPTADFTVLSLKGCIPFNANFTSTSTAGDGLITSYFWDFGDGNTQQGANLSQINNAYNSVQQPTVSLTVTNSFGCQSTVEKTKFLNVLPAINALFTANKTVLCNVTDAVSLTNKTTGSGFLNYDWDFGDGTNSTNINPSHIYNQKGNYTVKLNVNSSDGCSGSYTLSPAINVANFAADFDVPSILCEKISIYFNDKSTATPDSWEWLFSDNSKLTTKNVSKIFNAAGNYSLTLTSTYSGCKVQATKSFTVNTSPTLSNFSIDKTFFCESPATINVKDQSAFAQNRKWDFNFPNNTDTANTSAASFTYKTDGSYVVNLKATDVNGCSASAKKSVFIGKPNITIVYTNSTSNTGVTGCPGFTVNFAATPSNLIAAYKWDFGDSTFSTSAVPSHTFTAVKFYTIKLTYTTIDGCVGDVVYNDWVRVYQKPKASFTVSAPTVCGNNPLLFTQTTNPSQQYFWNFGDVDSSTYFYTTETTVTHKYYKEGTYSVTLIAYNETCSDTITQAAAITVFPPFPKIDSIFNTCDGDRSMVRFHHKSTGVITGVWNFGDGVTQPFVQNQPYVQHKYAKTAPYQVILTATNAQCTVADTVYPSVLLKQNPLLTAERITICASDSLNIKVSNLETNYAVAASKDNYAFSSIEYEDKSIFGGSYTTDSTNWKTSYTGKLNGFVNDKTGVRAILTSAFFGCNDTTNFIPLKTIGPVAGFKIVDSILCYKMPFTFIDTSKAKNNVAIKTWQWTFGDATSVTLNNSLSFVHVYDNPNSYLAALTVTDTLGCASSTAINLHPLKAKGPKVDFTWSPSPVFPNTTVFFTNNTNDFGNTGTKYKWTFSSDGSVSTVTSPAHFYATTGVENVKLYASNTTNGCTDSITKSFNIKTISSSFTFVTQYINNNACPPLVAYFTSTSINIIKIHWDFGDGNTAENITTPSHTYFKPGTYKITLVGYGINDVVDTAIVYLAVKGPVANFTADVIKSCTPAKVVLTATGSNSKTYIWDYGDGTLIQNNDTTSSHIYTTPGIYSPLLIMKDSLGCAANYSLSDKIVMDSLYASFTKNTKHICDSGIINFNSAVYNIGFDNFQLPLNYSWNFGTNNIADSSNLTNPSFKFNVLGKYAITLKMKSDAGCSIQVTDTISVTPTSHGTIVAPIFICENTTATFTSTATIPGNLKWNWDFNNGKKDSVQNPLQQLYKDSGLYKIKLIVEKEACFDTSFYSLTVHQNPILHASATQSYVCLGTPVQLSAKNADVYNWQPASSLNKNNIANPFASPLNNTTFIVHATNLYGCSNTDSVSLQVFKPFKLSFVDNEAFVCKGSSVQLKANGADHFKWYVNNNVNDSVTKPYLVTPKGDAKYTVVGYDIHECFTDTSMVNVFVKPYPTINAGPDVTTATGSQVQLNATGSSDINYWKWQPSTYLDCATCPSPISTPRSNINYVVTGTTEYGCSASDSVSISLICNQGAVYIPTGFTPNKDGLNEVFYPMGKGVKVVKHFVIFDRWGNKIFERSAFNINDKSQGWNGTYNGLQSPSGSYVYIVELTCDTGEDFTVKGTITLIR